MSRGIKKRFLVKPLAKFNFYGILRKMSFLLQILIGITGFFLANQFIEGVAIDPLIMIVYAGIVLGIINSFIKPILKLITFPLHIITFGLSSFLINIGIIWFIQAIFLEISIDVFLPLFYTTIVIWILELIFYNTQ